MEKTEETEYVYDNGFKPKEVTLKDNYKYYNNNIIFRFFQTSFKFITMIFFINFFKLFNGVKIKGKKNLKGIKGCLIIPMHIHPLDSFINVTAFPLYNTYTTMLQSNMGFGLFSKYIRICGAVPIPVKMSQLREFEKQTVNSLQKNKRITFFAEASLHPYHPGVREFKKGAFKYAVLANVPVVPCVTTYRKRKNPKKNPKLTFNYLDPIFPTNEIQRDAIINLQEKTYSTMVEFFNLNSEIKTVTK